MGLGESKATLPCSVLRPESHRLRPRASSAASPSQSVDLG